MEEASTLLEDEYGIIVSDDWLPYFFGPFWRIVSIFERLKEKRKRKDEKDLKPFFFRMNRFLMRFHRAATGD